MKRPVAASAAAEAAENAPHARPIQARRVRSGDVSSASRARHGLARPPAPRLRPPPPRRRTRPTSSCPRDRDGAAGGRGAAGLAACAARRGRCGRRSGARQASGLVSSAMSCYPITFSASSAACANLHAAILLAQGRHRGLERLVLERCRRAQAADHHVGNRILILVLPHVALDRAARRRRGRSSAG